MPGTVNRLEIQQRLSPVFDGRTFGTVGAYECINGVMVGALDPDHPLNADIVNLCLAPRNDAGMVEYRSAFSIMRPMDPTKGNGWLLYDVPNRGNKFALTRLNRGADGNAPITAAHAGDGFLMQQGFSVVWSAWQTEVPAGGDRLNAEFPLPTETIVKINRDEFIPEGMGGPGDAFIQETSDTVFIATLSYPAADMDPTKASLTVRLREQDPRATPPDLTWRYVDARHIEIVRPVASGYDRGAIYEFIYPARDPVVMGIGFAAMRDLVSFLRHDPDQLAGPIRYTVGFGISQSGRVLRDFVHLGFNQDLQGRQVFDAIFPIVGGSRRTFINHAFAQPGRYARQHEDHSYLDDQFPFTYPTLTDPLSGKTDGILRRATEAGVCPKVFHLDTDADLWVGRASLVATDCEGNDTAMPDNVRIFMASGIQHAVNKPQPRRVTEQPGNPLGYGSYMRALLLALTQWVENGTPPPDSQFPSRADGTLVTREDAERGFPAIPGMSFPDILNELHLRDHSVEPPIDGPAYQVLVCAVDADGNSLGGLRHPLLSAPYATHTGWAVRIAGYAAGDLFTVQGSCAPFPVTKADRLSSGDPRLSFDERYSSRADWLRRVQDAAAVLVTQRVMLAEDAEALLAACRANGDGLAVL